MNELIDLLDMAIEGKVTRQDARRMLEIILARQKTIIVKSATVVTGSGSDKVFLRTDLPCGIFPFRDGQTLTADIAWGDGERWCQDHVGIEPEVVRRHS